MTTVAGIRKLDLIITCCSGAVAMLTKTIPSLITLACLAHTVAFGVEPVASNRSNAVGVLDYLSALTSEDHTGFLSGQNLGHGNFEPRVSFQANVARLERLTGQVPAILAVDFGFDEIPGRLHTSTELLADHAQRGGIIAASMHPPNPWRNSEAHDRRIGDVSDLWTPNSAAYRRWRRDLARVGGALAELRDQGHVVLWRPLHEMNGEWFWWGANQGKHGLTPADYTRLWKEMFAFFTDELGLDNLLWVYSPAVQVQAKMPSVLACYPGDAFVDVVALDWYDDQLQNLDSYGSYAQLVSLNKPMGLAEFGPKDQRDGSFECDSMIACLSSQYDKLGFFVFWHSWPGAKVAIVDQRGAMNLMEHDLVINRDELPALEKPSPTGSPR